MSRRLLAIVAALATSLFVFAPIGASAETEEDLEVPTEVAAAVAAGKVTTDTYIVVMAEEPLVATEGPDNLDSAKAKAKGRKLQDNQNRALREVGARPAAKVAEWTATVSGFAAELTAAQAEALAARDDVWVVQENEILQLQTDNTPEFLGLTDPAGPWAKGLDGEGVVVGVIDQGVWPEHPSFADDGSYGPPPASFSGTDCDFGNTGFNSSDAAFTCNNKLLAAKSYGTFFHGGTGAGLAPGSYNSARDENGHGSHTASTAAGNADVPVELLGVDRGTVTGVAPRARLSIYKACWSTTPTAGGCALGDLVDAIDDAVLDGVDVINYSIGSSSLLVGSDEIAFLFAADAGVHIATSASNSGPGASTVGSPAIVPWLSSVGASTHSREFVGSVDLGDGSSYSGITVTGGTSSLPLVDGDDVALDPLAVNSDGIRLSELCYPGSLDPALVSGNIVLCRRGDIARVSKSQAVFDAGGAGMVMYNPALSTLNTDNHYVPSVHLDHVAGPAIETYIDTAGTGALATINGGAFTPTSGNVMAAFSSRGPNGLSSDLIKPDVTAPGVNVLAANTPTALLGAPDQLFQSVSGTSMSSPHMAGTLALLVQANPGWTPAMAKSAVMTTARQDVVKEDGSTPADPFDFGAGHIVPGGKAIKGSAFEPGLAYDADFFDYVAFLCGASPTNVSPSFCAALEGAGFSLDPSDLNYPSIAVGELVGSQTVKRTVTSVAKENGWRTYDVSVDSPAGFDVTVSPSTIRLKRGQQATYEVTFTYNGGAPLGEYRFGSLTWSDRTGHYDVRSPIALRAFQIDAPAEIFETGPAGFASFDVKFGYDGPYSAAAHGLEAPAKLDGSVVDDPADDINTALSTGIGRTFEVFLIPAGTAHTRVSLFDEFTSGTPCPDPGANPRPDCDDLDLYLFGPASAGFPFVASSGNPNSDEQVDVGLPAPGVYIAVVHGYDAEGGSSDYTLFNWNVPLGAGSGSLSVGSAPTTATLGGSGTVDISWSGLTSGEIYLGAVSHSDGSGLIGLTLVNVNA